MIFVSSLMPEKISVSPRIEHSFIIVAWVLAERKRNRAILIAFPDLGNDGADGVDRKSSFAALKHESAKPESVSLTAALRDLLFGEKIAVAVLV